MATLSFFGTFTDTFSLTWNCSTFILFFLAYCSDILLALRFVCEKALSRISVISGLGGSSAAWIFSSSMSSELGASLSSLMSYVAGSLSSVCTPKQLGHLQFDIFDVRGSRQFVILWFRGN